MHSPIALVPQLAGHIVAAAASGCAFVDACLRAAVRLSRRRTPHCPRPVVEFIHTATLLHDDVVDASELRRDVTPPTRSGAIKPAVLVGDFLFARAFQLMVEDGSLRVLEILSRASSVIAEGEVHSLMTANDTATTEAAYLESHRSEERQHYSRLPAGSVRSSLTARRTTRRRWIVSGTISASRTSWSMTCSTFPRDRPNSARPSATISATARSRCLS